MTVEEKRKLVANKYKIIIGRNYYSQTKRDYCYRKYSDGLYYSDCSSSISYAYKEAGLSFGILNTAGMYYCTKFTTINITTKNGVPTDFSKLRVGDMLLFAGSDASRPLKIGHVEMVYSINSDGTITICGHGSGRPSFKDLREYCISRYNSKAAGGWRKELACVKRFIQDDPIIPKKQYGWHNEYDHWRYYLGDSEGNAIRYVNGDWYRWKSDKDGQYYWSFFNGDNGFAICSDWLKYKDNWFYFNESCVMISSQWLKYKDNQYYFSSTGEMATNAYIQSKDPSKSNTYYWVNSDGIWEEQWTTENPDLTKYIVVI